MTQTNTLLAVDGNSLLHRSYHALESTGLSTRDGRPTWAVKGFMSQLLSAIDRAGADAVVIGFDDHTGSVRKVAHPHYKATRPPKAPELGQQIASTIELLRAAGIPVVVPAGLEADDILASAAAFAPTVGWRTVIVTSDRDSFALIDEHTNVLRVLNGGMEGSPILTPDRLFTMIGVQPSQYQEYAAMRGDPSDNLQGIRGIGEKTAAKLLTVFGTVSAAFADVDAGGANVQAALGKSFIIKLGLPEARAAFWRNVEIMAMHRDLPLGLDLGPGGSSLLPLDHDRVMGALEMFELTNLRGPAGRVLCHTHLTAPAAQVPQQREPQQLDLLPLEEPSWVREQEPAPQAARATVSSGAMRGSTAPRPTTWDESLF
jgi:5'-3' exonuclease